MISDCGIGGLDSGVIGSWFLDRRIFDLIGLEQYI